MTLFASNEKKYFRRLAAMNDGVVALTYKTRKGEKAPEKEAAFLVTTPRGYAVKLNELRMVGLSFKKKFDINENTYFTYRALEESFTATDESIELKDGRKIPLRKVPFYDSYLWDE